MNRNTLKRLQGPLMYLVLIVVVLIVVQMAGSTSRDNVVTYEYSDLLKLVEEDKLQNVMITDRTLVARLVGSQIPEAEFGARYDLTATIDSSTQFYNDVNIIYARKLGKPVSDISRNDYAFSVRVALPAGIPWWQELLPFIFTMVLVMVFWFLLMRQQSGGGGKNNVMNFGRSRARISDPSAHKVTFADVAGADEEKEELREIVDFLKNPKRFTDVGARIPKGVLLVGPPGTGKTLLARACSGEAGVPFFTISGSDFVEMFVGVGASRVRDLFDQAKKAAPAIVFIDEIDAVGRQRGAGLGGGHDEREQTLNQLLVEMDGFQHNEGVIVMAATNRSDILDPALLRPGRFDRQITVNYPDVKGREEILKVHSRGKPLAGDVDLAVLAMRTPYFTGADLENVMNEGAILTARAGHTEITMKVLEDAITKVGLGAEKKSYRVTDVDRNLVAYHEAGHAIVMNFIPECDRVHEISIIPRSKGAGGYTMSLPDEERQHISSKRLTANITSLLGGHCAESLVLGDVSTGSTSDLKRATAIARSMITEYGMSKKMGPIYLSTDREVFLGRDFSQSQITMSDQVAYEVDEEIRTLLGQCYQRALDILTEHRAELDTLAQALLKAEKVTEAQFRDIMGGQSAHEEPSEVEGEIVAPSLDAPEDGDALPEL